MASHTVQQILAKIIPELDDPVVEHLASIIADDPNFDPRHLCDSIGPLLIGYDAVEEEKEAEILCEDIFDQLESSGLLPEGKSSSMQSTAGEQKEAEWRNEWVVATEEARSRIFQGLRVEAMFSEDSAWYPAVVSRILPSGGIVVTYIGYEDQAEVAIHELKLSKSSTAHVSKKLAKPVQIQSFFAAEDLAKAKEKEQRKKLRQQAAADAPSQRRKKEEQAEKRRYDAMKEREARREKRNEERRKEAMMVYLNSTSKSRNTEINIDCFSMPTQDGGSELLTDATLRFAPGRRYGLIGRNGVGKTTLLRYIANYEIPQFPTHVRVVHVEQEVRGSDVSVITTVMNSDIEYVMLKEEEERLTEMINSDERVGRKHKAALEKKELKKMSAKKKTRMEKDAGEIEPEVRLGQVLERLTEIDADSAEARAATILSGLGFDSKMQNAATSSLSGGWRMRVSLASALFVEPDLLLLDEPTNHLDFPAVLWLEDYLRGYSKTLVVVSHDRVFLNNVITDVLFMKDVKLNYYRGNYTVFEETREEKMKQHKREFESNQRQRQHIQKFIDKFRFNAKRAALVQSRIKALNRLGDMDNVVDDPTFTFELPNPDPLQHNNVINCHDLTFGYTPDKILLQDVNVSLSMGSRIGVLGANGAGKTTLLKLFQGELEPLEGEIKRNTYARIATFTQHHVDQLKLHLSPLDLLLTLFPKVHPQLIRRHLGRFGVVGDLATQTIGTLSGGQKSRVAIAIITWRKPHVIFMDEPTNHLDLETIEALIVAITGFTGAVLVVSHDQHFLQNVAQEFWGFLNGRVKTFADLKSAKKFTYAQIAHID